MNNALNQIIYILTIVIERTAEQMTVEKDSENGLKLNHVLLKLEEAMIFLEDIQKTKV